MYLSAADVANWGLTPDEVRDCEDRGIDMALPAPVCYYGHTGCTAAIADHPKTDPTYRAGCPTHGPAVAQHYPGRERPYRCWHCVMAEFHGTTR